MGVKIQIFTPVYQVKKLTAQFDRFRCRQGRARACMIDVASNGSERSYFAQSR